MAFVNRYPNVVCDVCGKSIDIGAPMAWSRRSDQPSRRWHTSCAVEETASNGTEKTEQTMTGTKTETAVNAGNWVEGLAGTLLPFLEAKIATKLDAAEVKAIVESLLKGAILQTVTTVVVEDKRTNETRNIGTQHKQFPTLLAICNTRINAWLTGPAGSGKTTACMNVAKALGLKPYHIGAMDSDYKLMGFIDAQGRVVHTQFRDWYTNGGVLCLDEIDSWLPSATLALNAALDNGYCAFPDGLVQRHGDAVAIACANTWGLGATNDYVGRMKQDAAFLERFPAQLEWEYDESLELAISNNPAWVKRVQSLRAKAKAKGLKVIISPRASKYGAMLLASGMDQKMVEQLTVRKSMTVEQWSSIQ